MLWHRAESLQLVVLRVLCDCAAPRAKERSEGLNSRRKKRPVIVVPARKRKTFCCFLAQFKRRVNFDPVLRVQDGDAKTTAGSVNLESRVRRVWVTTSKWTSSLHDQQILCLVLRYLFDLLV